MASFAYTARDPLGKTIAGVLPAANSAAATQALARDGLQVVRLEEEGELRLMPRWITRRELIAVTHQLAIMTETGITLASALGGLAEQEKNPALLELLLDLKRKVESGADFSASLAEHPRCFDKTFVALVKASEQTGTLAEMLRDIADYQQRRQESQAKVRAALAYPAVMLVIAVAVTIFLLTYVLPQFQPLFNRKNVQLPTPTLVMIAVSHSLTGYWWAWILAAAGSLVGLTFARRAEQGRRVFDWVFLHAPVLGPVTRKVTLSRCLRTLGTMVRSGVSMLDAIRLTGEVSGNLYYERVWQGVLERIVNGDRIVDGLRDQPLFPSTLVQMMSSGEDTGKLDEVLARVSEHYDREVENALKAATSLIEPLLICVMGGVVGTIGLALLLPIFSLSRG